MAKQQTRRINKLKKSSFDYTFFMIVLALVTFGLIMVFSASAPSDYYESGNPYATIMRQFIWAVLGFVAMLVMSRIDYHILKKFAFPLMLVTLIMLILVPFIGITVNGATRWLGYGSFTFQPSEVAKIAVIIYFSFLLARSGDKIKKFKNLMFPYLALLGIIAVLMMLQPHMSGTLLICGTGVCLLLIGGAKISHFVAIGIPAVAAAGVLIVTSEYRMQRVLSFIDPFADKLGDGWQIIQSLYAIGSGGPFGLGLGQSRQKFLYIPEPHNDFIFSILCEELGYVGAAAVLLLFLWLVWRGFKIALNAPDKFGSLLAYGITILIALQVIINVAVVTSSMPVTGMPLPFFSYGGTTLTMQMFAMGIVLSISRYSRVTETQRGLVESGGIKA